MPISDLSSDVGSSDLLDLREPPSLHNVENMLPTERPHVMDGVEVGKLRDGRFVYIIKNLIDDDEFCFDLDMDRSVNPVPIGSASRREGMCQYGADSDVFVTLNKKKI